MPEASKKIGVIEQTYYRWKKKYGGLRMEQAKRLKDLESEAERASTMALTSGCGHSIVTMCAATTG